MDIKAQLTAIINHEKLTSSAFADSIGVQRSSISHILSGRNKPSLDFLQKILTSYPKYNAEWLILGHGDMLKTDKGLKFQASNKQLKEMPNQVQNPLNNLFSQSKQPVNQVTNPKEIAEPEKAKEEPIESYSTPSNKHIDKIIILFNDGTFDAYKPNH